MVLKVQGGDLPGFRVHWEKKSDFYESWGR
jgi:hypothetical protein